jgi:hypothetical protein
MGVNVIVEKRWQELDSVDTQCGTAKLHRRRLRAKMRSFT